MIKYLGNKKQSLRRIFKRQNAVVPNHDNSALNNSTRRFYNNVKSGRMSSWFLKPDCVTKHWHVDANGTYSMMISSYPNPTEILIPKTKKAKNFIKRIEYSLLDQLEVERMILNGDFKVFMPAIGDIYYLPRKTIHRTNPKSIGQDHLVIRIWNPTVKDVAKVKRAT